MVFRNISWSFQGWDNLAYVLSPDIPLLNNNKNAIVQESNTKHVICYLSGYANKPQIIFIFKDI